MSCRASVSSLASGSDQLSNKMPEASGLSQESLSETESPTLAAYPRSVYLQVFSPHSKLLRAISLLWYTLNLYAAGKSEGRQNSNYSEKALSSWLMIWDASQATKED